MLPFAFLLLTSSIFTYAVYDVLSTPYSSRFSNDLQAYGTIIHGVIAYGFNKDNKHVISPIYTHDGQSSIKAINYLWYNTTAVYICVKPICKTGKINYNSNNYDYGALNNGMMAIGINNFDSPETREITSSYITKNGLKSINIFTDIVVSNSIINYICFMPLSER